MNDDSIPPEAKAFLAGYRDGLRDAPDILASRARLEALCWPIERLNPANGQPWTDEEKRGLGIPVEPTVATPRNAPDLRDELAAVFKAKDGKLPTWMSGGADTVGALVDELLAVVDAALPDRAQAAIRAAAAQVQVRDRQLAAVRALLADPDNRWAIEPGDLRAALGMSEAGQ